MAFAYGYFNVAKPDMEGDVLSIAGCHEHIMVSSSESEQWNDDEYVWVLGQKFCLPQEKFNFIGSVRSKLWFTYRKGFSAIGGTGPTSDSGWGCMLRCGQMMLAQALSVLNLGGDWHWNANEKNQTPQYWKILSQLCDQRSRCYSIHQIAQMGVQEGKEVGEWFGPNTVSQVIRKLSQFDEENVMAVHVAMDNTVCIDDIERLCCIKPLDVERHEDVSSCSSCKLEDDSDSSNFFWKPLFLIIPLRLGLSEINPMYFTNLKECLRWHESVGIIGGKPNHAYYFLGCSDKSLIFLDPHTTQPVQKFPDKQNSSQAFDDTTYHCDCPRQMELTQLDPSLALGFFCSTRSQFDLFCQKAQAVRRTASALPLFEVVERMPQCTAVASRPLKSTRHRSSRHRRSDSASSGEKSDQQVCFLLDSDATTTDDDDFEVLDIT